MADLQDLSAAAGDGALTFDRAIFTSLPSPTGEGYRLVAWSAGIRAEERIEFTRRAPSHGSVCGDGAAARGAFVFRLQSSGRVAHGFVRLSGAEHTRRGGGRVWTDFLVATAADVARIGLSLHAMRSALAAEAPPKPPLGSSALGRVTAAAAVSGAWTPRDARSVANAAAVACLLGDGRTRVIAAGDAAAQLFEDAHAMMPACTRGGIDACGGLRFTSARGVKTTVTDRIDPETIRATRGQGIECVDLGSTSPAIGGALAPWFALMSRWSNEGRGGDATDLADRLTGAWTAGEILEVAALAESADRGGDASGVLERLLQRKTAA